MQWLRVAFAFMLILALVPALSVTPPNVAGQGYVTITTQTTTTGLYTYAATTSYATTVQTTTSAYYSGHLTVPVPDPSLTNDPCGYVSLRFSVAKGQHVSVSLTSQTAFSFLVMSDSVRKSWTWSGYPVLGASANSVTPCHNVPSGTLIRKSGITSYTTSFDFPTSEDYWFWFLNWVYTPIEVDFDMVGSPIVFTSTLSLVSYVTAPTTELFALTTAVSQVGLPFGNLGLLVASAAVAVIAGVLVVMRRRKSSVATTLIQQRPATVQESSKEAVTIQPVTQAPATAGLKQEHPATVLKSPRDAIVPQPVTKPQAAVALKQERAATVQEPRRDIAPSQPVVQSKAVQSQPIVSTGYVDLDRALDGGIPEEFAVVVVSPSYDERDLLLRKVIESALSSGRPAFFVSNDIGRTKDLTSRYPQAFYAFSPQADKIPSHGPNLVKIPNMDNLSDANISLNLVLKDVVAKGSGSRPIIIIDILEDVLLRHKSIIARRWLTDFVGKRKAEGFTILATLNPLTTTKEESQAIIDFFDGVIEIYEKPLKERSRRFLIIRKMYGRRYSENDMLIDKDKLF